MNNLVVKLEEIIRHQDPNDLAADAIQGIALTAIGIVLVAWVVMMITI